jgi:hypothetical protein
MHARLLLLALLSLTLRTYAQFEIEESHTTASLRGIDNVGDGVAWASGTEGTVLRTTDDGTTWQRCTTPPNAEHLDFRGIQAFDENTAIVMSSGKGDLSRLYKTTDGCKSWKLLFTNPDKEGFWDAVGWDITKHTIRILGDPVEGHFRLFSQMGENIPFTLKLPADNTSLLNGPNEIPLDYTPSKDTQIRSLPGETLFAASNSLLLNREDEEHGVFITPAFITGGPKPEFIMYVKAILGHGIYYSDWNRAPLPLAHGPTSGAFSVATGALEVTQNEYRQPYIPIVVVGGDYKKPDSSVHTAAFSLDSGLHFLPAETPPHGYRSSVAYDSKTKTWITVGPNGTDISRDDGRNWTPLKPGLLDTPDADKNWNALSLPFVVGPRGRIGKLRPNALKP